MYSQTEKAMHAFAPTNPILFVYPIVPPVAATDAPVDVDVMLVITDGERRLPDISPWL
jgi:hypothetical protein